MNFLDDPDRQRFLRLLAELPERFGGIQAFVLMDRHDHHLLRTPFPYIAWSLMPVPA